MKELSIEEKAKRYDEAIKVAKSNYETIVQMDNDCTFAKEGIVNTFHHIFPELQESKENDDERISKVLIHIVKGACSKYGIKYRGQEISEEKLLAWLEKQGEKSILFTFDDVLALQCCMETVKKVQEDKELYNELLLLHNKVYDAYTITKDKL